MQKVMDKSLVAEKADFFNNFNQANKVVKIADINDRPLKKAKIIDEKVMIGNKKGFTVEEIDPIKELENVHASAKMTDSAFGVDHYFDFQANDPFPIEGSDFLDEYQWSQDEYLILEKLLLNEM